MTKFKATRTVVNKTEEGKQSESDQQIFEVAMIQPAQSARYACVTSMI